MEKRFLRKLEDITRRNRIKMARTVNLKIELMNDEIMEGQFRLFGHTYRGKG